MESFRSMKPLRSRLADCLPAMAALCSSLCRAFFGPAAAVAVFVAAAVAGAPDPLPASIPAQEPFSASARAILSRMNRAWSEISSYRMHVEQTTYARDGTPEVTKATYTYWKTGGRIRIDMQQPHAGMVLLYPDENGRVEVKPGGILTFFRMHLAPDSRLITSRLGQPIDQTSLGLLIRNIGLSMTRERRGPLGIEQNAGLLNVRVLAENHFDRQRLTDYHFEIDTALWLPVAVTERSADGSLERRTVFTDLKLDVAPPV